MQSKQSTDPNTMETKQSLIIQTPVTELLPLRLDKNIANSIDILWVDELRIDNETKMLIKKIIFFMCLQRQTNLFGFGTIDYAEFARTMNCSEKWLKNKHSNPFELRGLSPEDVKRRYEEAKNNPALKVWDGNLENAVFIINSQAVQLRSGASEYIYEDGVKTRVDISSLKSYVILQSAEIRSVKSKRGLPKNMITYRADDRFINNMSRLFNSFTLKSVLQLQSQKFDDLYMVLQVFKNELVYKKKEALKAAGKDGTVQLDTSRYFDHLCEVAHISLYKENGTPYEPRKVKYKLNKALEEIATKTDLKFKVQWKKKDNSRWNYVPYFEFEEVNNIRRAFSHDGFHGEIEIRQDIFKENVLHSLLPYFLKYGSTVICVENVNFASYLLC